MVVKIVHDELVATLGSDGQTIDLNAVPPVAIMMVGLQGSGKTTTTAKLARRMVQRDKRKVLMASLDIYRPAAMEQLAVLGRDLDIPTLPIVAGQKPAQIARRALEAGALVRPARRPDRHCADQGRRRWPRRRGAVDACGYRQADQADRHRRKD
jgi:signal recognition particle subunit SRP54